MLRIDTSQDWARVDHELQKDIKNLPYHVRMDLEKINKNISNLVTELSTAEIQCRRHHKTTHTFIELQEKCNTMIADYQKMIMMGKLL
jgi:tRNA(Ser,Leu) C12 N-acetylase TAN1